ncbi:MAG: hypothetical protein KatS3mg002_1159 [Candidatus Woesearchaeota archaeon]|nr:MAG: hypothetical protein KatS3mg002_1159 [Candidatus Woesearchaeota archaeon]
MVRIISKSKRYIDELKEYFNIEDEVDSHKINKLYSIREKLIKSKNTLNILRIIFFLALYASLLSGLTKIFNLLPWISTFIDFVLTFLGILGTTFSVIMILVLGQSIRNYDRDISTIESHILSIYVKYDKTDKEKFDGLMDKIR